MAPGEPTFDPILSTASSKLNGTFEERPNLQSTEVDEIIFSKNNVRVREEIGEEKRSVRMKDRW